MSIRSAVAALAVSAAALVPLGPIRDLVVPLQPALELVSPIAWPLCADAVVVSALPGVAAGVELPPAIVEAAAPLFVLCGAVPEPGTQSRTCALDDQAQALISTLTKPLLGVGLPIEVAPTKWVSGQVDTIVDLVDMPAVPIGSTIAATLRCTNAPVERPTPPTASDPPTTGNDTEEAFVQPDIGLPTFEDLQTLPPLDPGLVASPELGPVASPRVSPIGDSGFAYPAVVGLPLLLVAMLACFGRILTRPMTR